MKKNLCLILLGIAIGLSLAVAVAYMFGPYESTTKTNLFNGRRWKEYRWVWHRWDTETEQPSDYAKWASSHMDKELNWPVGFTISHRRWFGGREYISVRYPRNIPRRIYNMDVREEKKIKLLHEYHEELQGIRSKNPHYYKLCEKWYQKLTRNH